MFAVYMFFVTYVAIAVVCIVCQAPLWLMPVDVLVSLGVSGTLMYRCK